METIILFAPLVGALICGFGWRLIGEEAAQWTATGLLFLAALLSWIVFLTFRQKLAGIGLSLMLLVVLSSTFGAENLLTGSDAFLRYYSYPLKLFADLAQVFGILYCVTSFLSLLFHLPTTGDFQRKAGEVTAMHSVTNLVSQVFDPDMLYRTIVASPVEAVGASSAWLAVADPQTGTLRPRLVASHGIPTTRLAEVIDTTSLALPRLMGSPSPFSSIARIIPSTRSVT